MKVFDFTVKDIRGGDVALSQYEGKLLLIVNTASKCGFTHIKHSMLLRKHGNSLTVQV